MRHKEKKESVAEGEMPNYNKAPDYPKEKNPLAWMSFRDAFTIKEACFLHL